MSERPSFSLSDYVVDTDEVAIPVCIAKQPFRIHPSKKRSAGPLLLARPDQRDWWLVHPDIAQRYQIPHLWTADLYQGIWADGGSFLMPVTHPRAGGPTGWYDTLTEAVTLARTQWVTVKADHDNECYIVAEAKSSWRAAPDWPDWTFADMVEYAFADRVIATKADVKGRFAPKGGRRVVHEEDEFA